MYFTMVLKPLVGGSPPTHIQIYIYIYIYIYGHVYFVSYPPKRQFFDEISGSCFEQNINVLGSWNYSAESGTVENLSDF